MRPIKPLLLLLCATVPATAILMDSLHSESKGKMPTQSGPDAYARSGPSNGQSCGTCHTPFSGGPTVTVAPSARVMSPGQKITITVSSTGGAARHPNLGWAGGFAADVTGGTLAAGTGSRVNTTGTAITHSDSFTAQRVWQFGYTAPGKPGQVDFWTVVNTVNGNGQNTGDQWAWHGSSHLNSFSTPVRLYVNGTGVQVVGTGCPDGNRNVGVLGAPAAPTLGQTFRLEGIGLPPAQRCLLVFGFQKAFTPISVANLGAAGCFLNTDLSPLQLFLQTSGPNTTQNRKLASGSFSLAAPVPNQSALKGLFFRAQLLVADQDAKNPFPVVFTNGLAFTVQ
ncbi:MAG: choice-of-anchor V domain-containing protein [Planctomycetota bacterium]